MRIKSKKIYCGDVAIGGNSPISVQSMTNTDTRDIISTVSQVKRLEVEGCDIVRLAILDNEAAEAIKKIKSEVDIPIIADIHFDYRLAIMAVKNGVDGLRINPGNIGDKENIKKIVDVCKERHIPIRIGVNSGSLSKDILNKFNGVSDDAIVYSALEEIEILEDLNYTNLKVSLKSSDVRMTISSYEKISKLIDYPLHIGITEAGTTWGGTIKSAVGIGSILLKGIGDTIRVSLTGDPVEEIRVGKQILRTIGLRNDGIEIISCPTCGRTEVDIINLANEIEKLTKDIKKPIKVAIMGCVVNGPGEAREADIGIAGGKGSGILFKKGKIIKKLREEELLKELMKEIEKI